MTTNNSESKWFDTVAAWAYAGGTPAQHLADDLRTAGKVAAPGSDQQDDSVLGDEWGWLALAEDAPDLEPPAHLEEEELAVSVGAEQLLDVDDDPVVAAAAPRRKASRGSDHAGRRQRDQQGKRPTGRMLVAGLAAAAVVIVAAALAAGMLFGGASEDSAPQDPVEVLANTPGATAVADDCPESVDGPVTTGNDSGDQESGPGVIKAFDYAYYVDRSGERARTVATPSGVGSAKDLQASIDALPADTSHCLRITDRGNGLYAVQLTETRPGEQPIVYPQLIQTVQADGKTWIASIKKDTP